jgi:nucleoside phosphorylase
MKSYDVVVIVPLAEEFDHIKQVFDVEHSFIKNKITFYELSFTGIKSSQLEIDIVAIILSQMGNTNAAQKTERVLATIGTPRPQIVALVGIAGRLDDDLQLSDVVIGTEVSNYEVRSKLTKHGSQSKEPNKDGCDGEPVKKQLDDVGVPLVNWKFGGRTYTVAPEVSEAVAQFRNNRTHYTEWQTETSETVTSWVKENLSPEQLHSNLGGTESIPDDDDTAELTPEQFEGDVSAETEPLASGSFVVTSREFVDKLLQQNRNFAAVEMEAAGVLLAVGRTDGVNSLVIRGISDFADSGKANLDDMDGGIFRKCATYAAANYLAHLLHNGYLEVLAPQQSNTLGRSDSIKAVRTSELSRADLDELTSDGFIISPDGSADNYVRRYVSSSGLVVRDTPPQNGIVISTKFKLKPPKPLRLVSVNITTDSLSRMEYRYQQVTIDGVRQSMRSETERYLSEPFQFIHDEPATLEMEKRLELLEPSEESIESGDSLPIKILCEFEGASSEDTIYYLIRGYISPVEGLQVVEDELRKD